MFAGTPSGSEAPSSRPSPPSSRCGSPSRSTTSPAPPSSTGSASSSSSRLYRFQSVSYLSAAKVIFVSNTHCQEAPKRAEYQFPSIPSVHCFSSCACLWHLLSPLRCLFSHFFQLTVPSYSTQNTLSFDPQLLYLGTLNAE